MGIIKNQLSPEFEDAIMNIVPPLATFPSSIQIDGTFPYMVSSKPLNLNYQKNIVSFGPDHQVVHMNRVKEVDKADRGYLRGVTDVDAYFWQPLPDNYVTMGAIFRATCQYRQHLNWLRHCRIMEESQMGAKFYYPKENFTKRNTPAYSINGISAFNPKIKGKIPGPSDYIIKRDFSEEDPFGCTFKGLNKQELMVNNAKYYNTANHKAVGTEAPFPVIGRKLNGKSKNDTEFKLYNPKSPSKSGLTFGIKREIPKMKSFKSRFYPTVSSNVIKPKAPISTIRSRNHPTLGNTLNTDIKCGPGDLLPKLSHKTSAPKYSMKFIPRINRLDQFGDTQTHKNELNDNIPGPQAYDVNRDTNDHRTHLFTYRYNGICGLNDLNRCTFLKDKKRNDSKPIKTSP
ncbi:hypothetical protein SNEBB_000350 [Seison nebaliae]|nr:hypothetical protein SNEBB_000350 [Seison nebaliae]